MERFALKTELAYYRDGEIKTHHNGVIYIQNGLVEKISDDFDGSCLLIEQKNSILIPGLTDSHVHAAQYAQCGLGLDRELLPWLQTYTFPEEAKFADLGYARDVYSRFVSELVAVGTVRAVIFATVHVPATLLLMEIIEQSGITAMVGKVNMNNNCPDYISETNSAEATLAWLSACGDFKNVAPIITPRFAPSCTVDLLAELGKIAKDKSLPVQSHLSENHGEIEFVHELFPDAIDYVDVYARAGLFGQTPTVMAHCIHMTEREKSLLIDNGVYVSHCPDSNINLNSGIANIRNLLDSGAKVTIGSDIAGGSQLDMIDNAATAVKCSKLLAERLNQPDVSFAEAFAAITCTGAEFFGTTADFRPGEPFYGVAIGEKMPFIREDIPIIDKLQRLMYLPTQRIVRAVYAGERRLI